MPSLAHSVAHRGYVRLALSASLMLMTDFQWQLSYKDGFAIFKGVSPYPEVEKYMECKLVISSL